MCGTLVLVCETMMLAQQVRVRNWNGRNKFIARVIELTFLVDRALKTISLAAAANSGRNKDTQLTVIVTGLGVLWFFSLDKI